MTNYIRVIPRDLFNEAKLLKCVAMLYLAGERLPEGELVVEERMGEDERQGWNIVQNPADGSISVANVAILLRGRALHCFTPLNSRRPHPLYAQLDGGDPVEVFDGEGYCTADFLALAAAP